MVALVPRRVFSYFYRVIPRIAFTTSEPMPIGIMYFQPMSMSWS